MECVCLVSTAQEELSQYDDRSDNFSKQELHSERQKQTMYKISSRAIRAFENLDSFRMNDVLCDIKLETDDGTIVLGHKVVLASASPYFRALFTNFKESKKNHVILRELDSTALKLLLDFIYSSRIMITEDNVQDLLRTANLLMLNDVEEACCDFLLAQLNPTNCFGIKSLVSMYGCDEYLSNFNLYIQQNFRNVVESDEFMSLRYEEVAELISCNELNDPSEEKVFECVINWVNHNSNSRKDVFPKLMEHVRLPLASKEYLLNKVKEEPIFKNSFECRNYLIEALHFKLKSEQPGIISETIHTKPRQLIGLPKVILAVGEIARGMAMIQWYDSSINKWQPGFIISTPYYFTKVEILNGRYLFFLCGLWETQRDGVIYMLDIFSSYPYLNKSVSMLINRTWVGVGVLDDCIYAVGGTGNDVCLRSAEVFNFNTQKWKMISEMSTARHSCGVAVFNNHVYAIGGVGVSNNALKSVERYCPKSDRWMPVANMNENRCEVGVGILNGLIYAVGGSNGLHNPHNSVETYNPVSNVWSTVPNMHMYRREPGVAVQDGLLYVVGGGDQFYMPLYSTEVYNPKSKVWQMISSDITGDLSGVVIADKSLHF